MRYSIVKKMLDMCDTLADVSAYLQHSLPSDEIDNICSAGREMLCSIQNILQENTSDIKDTMLFILLDKQIRKWQPKNCRILKIQEIRQLQNALRQMVHYTLKIVFLAEMGEKWDSMNTCYEAFLKREDCETIIVLTPVFRESVINGKTQKELFYKDYLTPMGIPFKDYKNYDIEKDSPDMVFLSQPYDSCTVEQFWPVNMAAYTRVIYLPYFVKHTYDETPVALCQLEVFCNAWKVIGFSDKHYEYYKKYNPLKGSNMVVTGPPKWDGVIALQKNGLPEGQRNRAWEAKLKGKKVFLWNTWYDFEKSSLSYFQAIIQYMSENQDCALIWRLHPVTQKVTKMYCPQMYPVLMKMIGTAKRMPNVIFDETTSYEPAFCYSDAQISDSSSMMTQYLFMDKPLLWIKNVNMIEKGYLIDPTWMENADNENDIIQFFDRIKDGQDHNKDLRRVIREKDIPLADGNCGQRVCDTLIQLFKKEENIT